MQFKYSLSALLIATALIAVAIACYQCLFPPAPYDLPILGGRSSYYFSALNRDYVVEVTEEAIERSPKWDPQQINPPLGARDAMIAADRLRLSMIKDKRLPATSLSDEYWIIEAVELHSAGDERWYWLVRFAYVIDQSGPPHEFLVPVMMDGTVLVPKEVDSSGVPL